ncbi:MAG: M15 family metallopeptidase [Minisyncoccia bacterium]
MENKTSLGVKILLTLLALGAVGGLGFLGYQNHQLKQTKLTLEIELTNTKQDFASTTEKLGRDIETFRDLLITTQDEKVNAEQEARRQQELLDGMTNTLGLYQKLANTDRELLAKYSKVYFLNELYTPKLSIVIPTSYTLEPEKEKMISADVWPFLKKMLDDASATSTDLKIISAFRSFDTQSTLKSAYKITFGSGASTFSADQGYSEHQLGTTVDFSTLKLDLDNSKFEKTPAYEWLTENGYKYGFILSYPKGNSYYIFEPWHWRFVGKGLALRLHNENKNFYDLSQRDINEYLLTLFNQ